jgi:SAM-dependent methyltransferase
MTEPHDKDAPAESARETQNRRYWDANLDPDNLGRAAAAELDRERPFLESPEQAAARRHLDVKPGETLLELGAGLGLNAALMAERGARVIATDIAFSRLRAIAAQEQSVRPIGAVWPVHCRAEALPFRRDSIHAAMTRSVLIHTQLDATMSELGRVLRPGGRGAFIEPQPGNPFAALYRRTLAPAEWRSITTYFSNAEIATCLRALPGRARFDYLFGFLAFGWQFAVRSPLLFRLSLVVTQIIDGVIFAVCPPARRLAWFVTILVEKPRE